jgi:hypothetical protein
MTGFVINSHNEVSRALTRITALDNLASGAHGDYPSKVVAGGESTHYIELSTNPRHQSYDELQVRRDNLFKFYLFWSHRQSHDVDSCDLRFSYATPPKRQMRNARLLRI